MRAEFVGVGVRIAIRVIADTPEDRARLQLFAEQSAAERSRAWVYQAADTDPAIGTDFLQFQS